MPAPNPQREGLYDCDGAGALVECSSAVAHGQTDENEQLHPKDCGSAGWRARCVVSPAALCQGMVHAAKTKKRLLRLAAKSLRR